MTLCPVQFIVNYFQEMMLAQRFDTWKLALDLDRSNPFLNEKMLEICHMSKPGLSAAECVDNLRSNPGSAALAVDHFQEIVLLHNITVLGPNIRVPDTMILALSGSGPVADCLRLPPSIFDTDLSIECPGWAEIKRASSASDIEALVVPDNATKQKFKAVLTIPPLIVNAILSSPSTKAVDLIPVISRAMQAYDREISADSTKACEHLRSVLFFLWAASKIFVTPSLMVPDRSSIGLEWSATVHSSHIQVPPVLPPPPAPISVDSEGTIDNEPRSAQVNGPTVFDNIADTLKILTDVASKEMLKEPSSSKTSKDSSATELLPDIIKNMILKMSSTQDDAFPEEFCTSMKEVMQQKKIIPATQVLQLMMRSLRCQVKISVPLMTAIRHGNFMPDSIMSSHAFSPFSVGYFDAANSDAQHQIKLDLLQSDGEGLSKEMVDSLMKENCSIPHSFHRLRHQMNNWLGVLMIVFGPNALVAKEAKQWISHMDENEQSYDGNYKIDPDFGAKLLGLVARTFYQFAASCQSANSPEEVNFGVLSLHHKRAKIEQLSFHANLPTFLISSQKPTPKHTRPDDDDDQPPPKGPKKPRTKEQKDLGSVVKNQDFVSAWDCKAVYRQLFTGKVIRTTPAFNASGVITCNKWHAQGHCFDKCERKASHKSFQDETHKQAYAKWIKKLKEDHSKP
jgi:hypothetical protein